MPLLTILIATGAWLAAIAILIAVCVAASQADRRDLHLRTGRAPRPTARMVAREPFLVVARRAYRSVGGV